MRLRNKVVLVAGAGGRQGTAVPVLFAREGARVALCGLDGAEMERLAGHIRAAGGEAATHAADLTAPDQADAAARFTLQAFGRIDVLYNNTGIYTAGDQHAHETDISTFRRLLQVNLETHFLAARAVLPHMVAQRSGVIINVAAARAARLGGNAGYAASKGAIIAMSKKLAREYAGDNIRVNCICPTDIQESASPLEAPPPQVLVTRAGTPEDVAYAALFLASDEAAWITGTELVVDGGAEVGAQ